MSTDFRWQRLVIGLAVALAAMVSASGADAQKKCRGTKVPFQGRCVYPHELPKVAPPKAVVPKKPTAAELKKKQQEEDARACEDAKLKDTVEDWEGYLQRYPEGSCQKEARDRIEALKAPKPPVEPPKPDKPLPDQPIEPSSPSPGISPLVYVGFGLAGAGLIIGSITGGVSMSQAADLKEECVYDVCTPEWQEDIDTSMALGHTSTAFFVIAGAGAGLGLAALLLLSGDSTSEEEAANIRPLIGAGVLGLEGSF